MAPWIAPATQAASFIAGWLFCSWLQRIWKRIPRWVVMLVYEAPLEGDSINSRKFVFYLCRKREIRGAEELAMRFLTRAGAMTAAADLKLSGDGEVKDEHKTFMANNRFRLAEIRVERIPRL